MMQVCYALGIDDPQKRDKSLASGRAALIEMVGEDKADETIKLLSNWSNDVHVNPDSFNRDQLDILEMEDSTKNLIAFGLEGDSVVKEIKDKLHKYNRHSKFASATAKVVNTTLSVVMLSPTILSPAAQAAQLVFVALTGGPEEAKLLKEVYLDRRFESRYKRLNAEANLAVSNYNRALSTKNPVLLAFSESIANNISGKASILEANKQAELDKADIAQAAEEAASKKKLKAHKTKTTQKEKLSLNKTQKESN
jgi:hypothetical protein